MQRELLADTSLDPGRVALEIPIRADNYRTKWPGIDLTLEAFAKHWPDLAAVTARTNMKYGRRDVSAGEILALGERLKAERLALEGDDERRSLAP